jgi:hypothetical protein
MLFPTITERLDVAGYSGTPLPKKLGIKDGHRVAILGAVLRTDVPRLRLL